MGRFSPIASGCDSVRSYAYPGESWRKQPPGPPQRPATAPRPGRCYVRPTSAYSVSSCVRPTSAYSGSQYSRPTSAYSGRAANGAAVLYDYNGTEISGHGGMWAYGCNAKLNDAPVGGGTADAGGGDATCGFLAGAPALDLLRRVRGSEDAGRLGVADRQEEAVAIAREMEERHSAAAAELRRCCQVLDGASAAVEELTLACQMANRLADTWHSEWRGLHRYGASGTLQEAGDVPGATQQYLAVGRSPDGATCDDEASRYEADILACKKALSMTASQLSACHKDLNSVCRKLRLFGGLDDNDPPTAQQIAMALLEEGLSKSRIMAEVEQQRPEGECYADDLLQIQVGMANVRRQSHHGVTKECDKNVKIEEAAKKACIRFGPRSENDALRNCVQEWYEVIARARYASVLNTMLALQASVLKEEELSEISRKAALRFGPRSDEACIRALMRGWHHVSSSSGACERRARIEIWCASKAAALSARDQASWLLQEAFHAWHHSILANKFMVLTERTERTDAKLTSMFSRLDNLVSSNAHFENTMFQAWRQSVADEKLMALTSAVDQDARIEIAMKKAACVLGPRTDDALLRYVMQTWCDMIGRDKLAALQHQMNVLERDAKLDAAMKHVASTFGPLTDHSLLQMMAHAWCDVVKHRKIEDMQASLQEMARDKTLDEVLKKAAVLFGPRTDDAALRTVMQGWSDVMSRAKAAKILRERVERHEHITKIVEDCQLARAKNSLQVVIHAWIDRVKHIMEIVEDCQLARAKDSLQVVIHAWIDRVKHEKRRLAKYSTRFIQKEIEGALLGAHFHFWKEFLVKRRDAARALVSAVAATTLSLVFQAWHDEVLKRRSQGRVSRLRSFVQGTSRHSVARNAKACVVQ